MMGELRVEGTVPYCVESCEVPKQSSAAQRPPEYVCVCVGGRTAHSRAAAAASSFAARDPGPLALCRVRKGRDQGQKPASPFPCPLCLSARCLPKEEWPNLSLHLIKMQGRRQTASSLLIREAGLRGSRA